MDRTNVTDKGYSYNGQDFTYQNKVNSQGQSYQVAVPSTISSTTLSAPQATIPVTQPAYNTGTQQTQSQGAAAYTANALTEAENIQKQNEITQRNEAINANSDLAKLQASIGGKGTDLLNAYNQQDATGNSVNSLAGKLRSLNAQSMALGLDNQAKTQREINNATGQNITQAAVTRNTTDATRENLINQASIAMQSAITKADYDTAKSYADQIVDAKYDQKLADIEAAKTNIQNIKDNLTATEKKVVDATTARLNKEKADAEKKMADEKAISDLVINASSQNAPQALRDKASKAKTPMEAANILGQYAGDYLAKEKIKAEIRKMDADFAKTRAEANAVSGAGSPSGSSNAKAWLDQFNSGALSLEDIYTKIGSTKEAGVLKNQVAQLVAAQGGKRKYGIDDASVQAINAQIKNVNDLLYGDGKTEADKTTGGVGKIVGVIQGGGGIFLPDSLNVGKQDALAVAKNLVSNQTLQALADAKSKGITFGALSEGELGLVSDAASRIASKLTKDKDGNITGFSGSESQFKKDLLKVKEGLQNSIVTKTQTTSTPAESTANDIMTANTSVQKQIQGTYNIFDK